ncbi:MAG TPA: acyltransferase, partial [Gemmatimonadaceae bacterium]|nr:acyltransferase [Gemmatimonadaceae bacterium]
MRTSAVGEVPRDRDRRLLYVDSMRVYGVLLVLVIHVAEVFNPWDEWHISNAQRSGIVGEVVVLMAPWIMPLMMLLAGVSTWYSLRRRGNGHYLRERTVRVFLPLVVGTLLLVPPQVYLERRMRGQFAGSFVEFYPHFFVGVYPTGNLSWHHLWFLAHLYGYSILALPLFRYLQHARGSRALRTAARVSAGPAGLLWLALPLVVERSLLWGLFPERHVLTSDWSNHALLFVAYVYGFVLAGTPWLGTVIDAQWSRALVAATIGSVAIMTGAWVGLLPARLPPPYSLAYLAFW